MFIPPGRDWSLSVAFLAVMRRGLASCTHKVPRVYPAAGPCRQLELDEWKEKG